MYRKDLKLQQHKQMARARAAADRTRKAKSWADQKKVERYLKPLRQDYKKNTLRKLIGKFSSLLSKPERFQNVK
jgi:hypothetical protein